LDNICHVLIEQELVISRHLRIKDLFQVTVSPTSRMMTVVSEWQKSRVFCDWLQNFSD
jgi:hypothetical protein